MNYETILGIIGASAFIFTLTLFAYKVISIIRMFLNTLQKPDQ
jgi:hypothetical protein